MGPGGNGGAGQGGGVFNSASGTLTIFNSTFNSNTVTGGAGYKSGVLHGPHGSGNGGLSAGGGTFEVENTILAGNNGNTARSTPVGST